MARKQRVVVLVGTETLFGQRVPRTVVHATGRTEQSGTLQSVVELFAQSGRSVDGRAILGTLSGKRTGDADRRGCLSVGDGGGFQEGLERRPEIPRRLCQEEWQAAGYDRVRTEEHAGLDVVDPSAEAHHGPVSHQLLPVVAQL